MDCLSWLGYLIYIYVFFCNNGFLKTLTCFTFWIRDKFQPDYSGCKALLWTACSFSLNCLLLQWLELSIAHLLPIAHSKSLLPLQLILTHFLLSQLWKQILIENPIALKQNSISNNIFFSTNFLDVPVHSFLWIVHLQHLQFQKVSQLDHHLPQREWWLKTWMSEH